MESLLRAPRAETHEHEVVRADGSVGWNQWTNYPVRGRDGVRIDAQLDRQLPHGRQKLTGFEASRPHGTLDARGNLCCAPPLDPIFS